MNGAPTSGSPKLEREARPRVLCVDDEPHILSAIRRQLRKLYDVTIIDTPEQALELLEDQTFEVIISDERMPGIPGHEFLAEAKMRAPDAMRILLTGQADPEDVASAINKSGIFKYLQKPWGDSELKEAIEAALNKRRELAMQREAREKTEAQNFRFAEYNRKLSAKVQKSNMELTEAQRTIREAAAQSAAAMVAMMDWADPVLGEHCKRVHDLVKAMVERMSLVKAEARAACHAALLHDIGKLKTGRSRSLDPELAFAHAQVGAELVASVPGLEYVAQCVAAHHERFDGRGYPGALSGEEIPLGARIIAVSNAFDHALYGAGHHNTASKEKAMEEVRKLTSRDFDPLVVAVLIEEVSKDAWVPSPGLTSVDILNLQPGMEIARTFRSLDGKVVAPEGHLLKEQDVQRIRKLGQTNTVPTHIIITQQA
ncbi:MAG: response regulator [Rhodothermales bacterium]|nr:response regulator [Rhodothermales bacterium]MBO6781165.1 response regulator [Rhodothermales bacterium]